jgi:3,4-dihydroxy 2-butanone 4-phosphate synthase / GTP cyclohydrolase II
MTHPPLSTIETIIADAKAGKMFILVDDEDRENEGDLVIPAEYADATAINFMATYGRGLICLPMTAAQIKKIGLPPMAKHNSSRHETAFTVSIEAREGVTTGISASDRARTIEAAINPDVHPADIATPGHIFPLEARDGGVLVRAGHTEAAVDISRLAGLNPAGVICEIMRDDGEMARLPDLILFAEKHKLHIASIADLIAYRRKHEKLVSRTHTAPFNSSYGSGFTLHLYTGQLHYAEHIALVKGDLASVDAPLVRMHALDVLTDVLLDTNNPRSGQLQSAIKIINDAGCGVIVLLRVPRPDVLSGKLAGDYKKTNDLKEYGIGAQILKDLGIQHMTLLTNNPMQVVGLDGYGLEITGYRSI